MSLREEASAVLGFHLPEDSTQWVDAIRSHTMGDIDANKKWNMTLMILMRLAKLESE